MTTFSSLVISLVLAALCIAIAWGIRQIKTWQVLIVFGVSVVLWILGAAFLLGWYPWTSVVDFLVAVGAGILLGRVIPAKFWPFFIFLLVLSALDVTQILLTRHPSTPAPLSASIQAGELYSNFFLQLPWGQYRIGPVDLLVIAAIGVYWRKKNTEFLVAFAGMAIGMIITYAILYVNPDSRLPLIPFLTLGWLCSTWAHRYRNHSKATLITRAE